MQNVTTNELILWLLRCWYRQRI